MSHLLGEAVLSEVTETDRVLDMQNADLFRLRRRGLPPATHRPRGLQREVLPQRSLVKDGWQVDYFTFRLTA